MNETYKDKDSCYVMSTYARKPVMFVRGEGMSLWDDKGKEYVDFLAGISVMNLGHTNRAVQRAICEQADKLIHVSNLFYVEHRAELAEMLTELFGFESRVFFANSGAEANEAAIKLARKWGHAHKPQATTIVTAFDSFHGRTLATVAATGQSKFSVPFAPVMQGFEHVPFNDIDAISEAVGESTIAVMLEVIQGESGVWPATAEYLDSVQRICTDRNVLLIIDEVQTGMYRTGTPFAFQHYHLEPDMITVAKALGNGLPIGALIAKSTISTEFVPGDHGSTFGGGPLVAAAARATLDELSRSEISENVVSIGDYARAQLAQVEGVTDVRGKGLMIGMSLESYSAQSLAAQLLADGFVVNAIGEKYIRLLPPLICTKTHIDALVAAIYAIINA